MHILIEKIKVSVLNSDYRKNIITLTSGVALSQIIPIMCSPILSRLYSPSDFGIYATFLSITGLISVVATLSYEQAVMLPKKDSEAINIVNLVVIIALITSLFTFFIILIGGTNLSLYFKNKTIIKWLPFVPVCVFLSAINQVLFVWNNRKSLYKQIAKIRVLQTVLSLLINIFMGYLSFHSGMIVGYIVGIFVIAMFLSIDFIKKNMLKKENYFCMRNIIDQAKKYKNYPKFTLWHTLVDQARENGLILIFYTFYNSSVVGSFFFAIRVIKTPLGVIGSSIAQVFYEKASNYYNYDKKKLLILIKSTIKYLIIIASTAFPLILIFGGFSFDFIFGNQWKNAGVISQIISLWIVINFISSPLSVIPQIIGKQKHFFCLGIIYTITSLGIFLIFSSSYLNTYIGIISFSAVSVIYHLYLIFWITMTVKSLACDA